MKTLSQLLFKRRTDLGLTLRDAAEIIGLSHTMIAKLENGEVEHPTVNSLALLSAGYKMNFVKLVKAAAAENNGRKKR